MGRIAVTGATGQLGSRVAALLAERGVPQRLCVRDPARAPKTEGAEVVAADYADTAGFRDALAGVSTLFLVSGHEGPERMDLHRSAVRAAAEAGVDRVVYTSFLGAAPLATFTFAREHAETERLIRESGLRLTALRNTLYADVAPHFVGSDGVLRGPSADGRLAWVARQDVARLAVECLLDDGHADQVYDVTGPEAIDLHETAALLSEVTGRKITYHAETLDEARASRAGAQDWEIDGWVGSYAAIATGEVSVTSHTVEHVTGRRPWTFAEFLAAEPEAWAHLK
ncbi:SDR family oxidoreductase [Amycolatopsis methanolica]|uniref:Nucleoside-diphosphate-sugar epimerase n=1 Tax=Amycolatopsis methanolica 239 TaxID=1068978 RepID=A0A076N2T2_AMYME|nr:SDR family oxidoreductase [Amycolatopsis methanolica]AIJ24287.1 nucleoside-diphosphate-sugar epimerase [Amycolatopsis methanolica 239]